VEITLSLGTCIPKMIDISFVVTAHNSELYIEKCLDSILNQEKSSITLELIVIDDGSFDNTRNLLSKYENKARIYFQANTGVEAAANFGIHKAKGRFVCRVDSDDALKSDFLKNISHHLQNHNNFYYGNYDLMNYNSKILKTMLLPDFSVSEILERGDFLATGTIFPKNLILDCGPYSEDIKNCGLENYELVVKMIIAGVIGVHIDKPLFSYRTHDQNMSNKKRLEIISYGNDMMMKQAKTKYLTNEFHPHGLRLN